MTAAAALSRTTRLINQEIFDTRADEEAIAKGLTATTVRLIADEVNMSSPGGQAALITTFQLIARMGIGVELVAPDTALLENVPPLRRPTLRAALLELGGDLIPGSMVRTAASEANQTFVFGASACTEPDAIRVSVTDLGCSLTRGGEDPARIDCECPLGGLAAAAAAAALALDAALPQIERATGMERTLHRRPSPGPPVHVDLAELFPALTASRARLSEVSLDVISAGAITNAFVAVVLWVVQGSAKIRVIDDDKVELSNVNRCPQIRASDEGRSKVDVLQGSSTPLLQITPEQARFTAETAELLGPLAEHVLVGVDDIPARWRVQEAEPRSLYVGATTNHEAILTTHHPGEPCAGCAYPDPAAAEGEFVPTISFVSFWGGLLQACALLAELLEDQSARRLTVFPFALGERSWFLSHELPHNARCPIGCSASAAARAPSAKACINGR